MPHRAAVPSRVLVAAALAALAGCDTVSENAPDVRFGVLEPSRPPEPQPEARIPEAEIRRRPVAAVTGIELGVTRTGRLLTVYGEAPTTGWFQPVLSPRNEARPAPDGFLEYDFLAAPPELNGAEPGLPGTPAQRTLRADRLLGDRTLAGAAGIRVFGAGGPPAALRLAPPAGETG